jgi:hypothetical protein
MAVVLVGIIRAAGYFGEKKETTSGKTDLMKLTYQFDQE